jgi:L-fuculose-phosphate aldolase
MSVLQFSRSSSESDLRRALVECGRICYERGLMVSNDGNLSARLDDATILITPSGISKGRMEAEDLLSLDLTGAVRAARNGRSPSSETPMHVEAYRQRPDVRAVIHAHPVFATALSVAGMEFPSDVLPEVVLTLGEVPTTPYATPSSDEDAEAVRELILTHNAILLCQHGSLTVGAHLEEALIHLERVEHVAEVFWRAQALGEVKRIPAEAHRRLSEMRSRFVSK